MAKGETVTFSAIETLRALYLLQFETAATDDEVAWYRSTFAKMCERYGLEPKTAEDMLEVVRMNWKNIHG